MCSTPARASAQFYKHAPAATTRMARYAQPCRVRRCAGYDRRPLRNGDPSMAALADKKALTLTAARAIVAAAEAEARKHNLAVTMSVVDDGGHLLHLARMDDTGLASVEV